MATQLELGDFTKDQLESMLSDAQLFTVYGSGYNRNIAVAYWDLKDAIRS